MRLSSNKTLLIMALVAGSTLSFMTHQVARAEVDARRPLPINFNAMILEENQKQADITDDLNKIYQETRLQQKSVERSTAEETQVADFLEQETNFSDDQELNADNRQPQSLSLPNVASVDPAR